MIKNKSDRVTNAGKPGVKTGRLPPLYLLIILYLAMSGLMVFFLLASDLLNMPIEHFTADPAAIYGAHPFAGMGSNVGILMWCITASLCLFTFFLLNRNRKNAGFFLFSGLITVILLLDDLFQLHEAIFPWYLNIREELFYVVYAIGMTWFFVQFRFQILDTEYIYLFMAIIFLGCSVLGDIILPQNGNAYLVEDGFKLFGITTWFFYFANVAYRQVSNELKFADAIHP